MLNMSNNASYSNRFFRSYLENKMNSFVVGIGCLCILRFTRLTRLFGNFSITKFLIFALYVNYKLQQDSCYLHPVKHFSPPLHFFFIKNCEYG